MGYIGYEGQNIFYKGQNIFYVGQNCQSKQNFLLGFKLLHVSFLGGGQVSNESWLAVYFLFYVNSDVNISHK